MNGTTLRIAAAGTCILALAAPSAALAKKHHKRAHKTATTAPVVTVQVPHDYMAGGNGAPLMTFGPGQVRLFDPLQLATNLGNQALAQLGLPPVQLPTL